MESIFQMKQVLQNVKSEELLPRFRSKYDLYKYLTHHSKSLLRSSLLTIVSLFLPSYDGTKLAFIRAILADQKKALKSHEIKKLPIPHYNELAVKNLYSDVMSDPIVKQYLPDLEMNSGKLPEREFFYGVLSTLKPEYVKKIVSTAEQNRYNDGVKRHESDNIVISDQWLEELRAHPYISSNSYSLTLIEKPGKAIHLIKSRSKLIKAKRSPKRYALGARIDGSKVIDEEMKDEQADSKKRRKIKGAS